MIWFPPRLPPFVQFLFSTCTAHIAFPKLFPTCSRISTSPLLGQKPYALVVGINQNAGHDPLALGSFAFISALPYKNSILPREMTRADDHGASGLPVGKSFFPVITRLPFLTLALSCVASVYTCCSLLIHPLGLASMVHFVGSGRPSVENSSPYTRVQLGLPSNTTVPLAL